MKAMEMKAAQGHGIELKTQENRSLCEGSLLFRDRTMFLSFVSRN